MKKNYLLACIIFLTSSLSVNAMLKKAQEQAGKKTTPSSGQPAGQLPGPNQPTTTNKPADVQSVTTTPVVPAGQLDQATQQALNDAKTAAVAVKEAARQLDRENKKKNINTNIEKTVIDQLVASLRS